MFVSPQATQLAAILFSQLGTFEAEFGASASRKVLTLCTSAPIRGGWRSEGGKPCITHMYTSNLRRRVSMNFWKKLTATS
jgi:hypothetical protein